MLQADVLQTIKLRGTIGELLAMYATNPTTRPAFARQKFCDCSLYMIFPSLWFFGGDIPANPLIAGEWCKVLPPF